MVDKAEEKGVEGLEGAGPSLARFFPRLPRFFRSPRNSVFVPFLGSEEAHTRLFHYLNLLSVPLNYAQACYSRTNSRISSITGPKRSQGPPSLSKIEMRDPLGPNDANRLPHGLGIEQYETLKAQVRDPDRPI